MLLLLPFALLASATAVAVAAPSVPQPIAAAVQIGLAVPGARVVVASYQPKLPPGCQVESGELRRSIDGSGRIAIKLEGASAAGQRCGGWAWIGVRVYGRVLVTTRAVREGEELAGATLEAEREIFSGHRPAQWVQGTSAARALASGAVIDESHLRIDALKVGAPLKVVVAAGALVVEMAGRVVSCGAGKACAVLPSGKHVEGTLTDGRLWVTLQ